MYPATHIHILVRGLALLSAFLFARAYGRNQSRALWQELPEGLLLLGLMAMGLAALVALAHFWPNIFGIRP